PANHPTRPRGRAGPPLSTAANGAGVAGASAVMPARRTCTLRPATARSLESATASRSGRLGLTRKLPLEVPSAVSPLPARRRLSSSTGAPETKTSYWSELDAAAGAAGVFAAGAVFPAAPLSDSSTLKFSSRSWRATRLAVSESLKAPTCTQYGAPPAIAGGGDGVVALAAA